MAVSALTERIRSELRKRFDLLRPLRFHWRGGEKLLSLITVFGQLPRCTPLHYPQSLLSTFHPIVFSSFLSLVFVGLFLACRNQRSVQITRSVLGKKLTQKLFQSPWAIPTCSGRESWNGVDERVETREEHGRRGQRGRWVEGERKLICPVSGTVLAFTQFSESEEFPG